MSVANSTVIFNTSTSLPVYVTEPDYWPDFGPLQYLEVVYLTIITVLGTIGNLIVMFSIALEKRVHAHGNIFIINLAIADLMVSAIIVPTVIANVIARSNALEHLFCEVVGYLVTSTCTCSLSNLMFIALNRYWAVVKPGTYQKTFTRKRVYYMVAFTWIWSIAAVCPTVLGWGGLTYDGKIMICTWDDSIALSYTYFITFVAIFLPLSIIAFCYFKLFATVRGSGRWVRSLSVGSGISQNSEQHRRSMRKERSLLHTLLTTVLLFCACWVPFGACVLINPSGTPKHAKKVFGWLALTNSCVNFIIYGAMNPVFRRGYHNLFLFIFRCKRAQLISSAMLHGSFSDSFKAAKRGTNSNLLNGNAQLSSRSETNKENSRIDTIAGVPPLTSRLTQTTLATYSPSMKHVRSCTNEPSPLAIQGDPLIAPPSPTPQKKGIVESIRRASLLRKARPRLNTADEKEEDRQWRLKRNSAMLLQIRMGENEFNSDEDEELARNQEERYSRRTVSDIPVSMSRYPTDEPAVTHQVNGNSNRNQKADNRDVDEIAKGPLRGRWIPDATVYTSRGNTPVLQRSQTKKASIQNTVRNSSPTKPQNTIQTISGGVEPNLSNHNTNEIELRKKLDKVTSSEDTVSSAPDIVDSAQEQLDIVICVLEHSEESSCAPTLEQEKSFLLPDVTEVATATDRIPEILTKEAGEEG